MIAILRNVLILFILFFVLPTYNKARAVDASILPQGVTQFLDDDGNPLSSGKVYFYIPNTLTFKTTWQNAAKSITNTNPVDLDAGGRAIIYGDGSYRQIVKKANGDTVFDAVTTSPLTGSTATLVGDGNLVSTVLPWSGLVAPAQYAFAYGQELTRATYPDFFAAITSSQTASCTSASPTITGLADTTQIIVGTAVEISCMAAGTTVVSKTLTTATLSNNSTVSATATALFLPWGGGNGTTTFNVPDLRGYNPVGRDNMGGTASLRLANGNGLARPLGISNFSYQTPITTLFTQQTFGSGSGATYSLPAGVTNILVRMVGAGGGGGARTTNSGVTGGTTSFSAWTAIGGSGGTVAGAGGAGGTGGNSGTGTTILRLNGGTGGVSSVQVDATGDGQAAFTGGMGGSPAVGGGAGPTAATTGGSATANTGAGGAGGNSLVATKGGGGGGAGEYVEFWMTAAQVAAAAPILYTVGGGGAGGAAGFISVSEYYNTTATTTTSFTATTSGTLEQQRTINYVVKITPDTSTSSATGVASLGGMTGVITCGSGLTCTSNNVAVSFPFFYTTLIASAQNVNLNSANTDNAMTVTLPSGTTNYTITGITVQNNGTTASLTTATGGLFSAAAGGGLALAANQALSAITSNAVNTDANSLNLTQTVATRTVINSGTLYFRVGTAQGAAATANIYVYAQPKP